VLRGRVILKGRVAEIRNAGGGWTDEAGRPIAMEGAEILPPVEPSKIVCVGRNYALHAKELGNEVPQRPLLFLKPPSAVLAHGGAILLPRDSQQMEYEGEIAVVIGKRCFDLDPGEDPMDFVAGVTPPNDVTARDPQKLGVPFTPAEAFHTLCPFGPWVAQGVPWQDLAVTTRLNGAVVQEGRASQMVFPIPELVRYAAGVMTLLPGDLIATGTPAGVGRLSPGDRISVEVAGIILENSVAQRKKA
jgi:2-keto-4-pentenoate hydratase/2-oxohepta-3-ene-1,7-dioic acid hydratase in catechol pathway